MKISTLLQYVRLAIPKYVKFDPMKMRITNFNDLPVPEGNWAVKNAARQKRYNSHLIMGISSVAISYGVFHVSGLNWLCPVPDRPAPREEDPKKKNSKKK